MEGSWALGLLKEETSGQVDGLSPVRPEPLIISVLTAQALSPNKCAFTVYFSIPFLLTLSSSEIQKARIKGLFYLWP